MKKTTIFQIGALILMMLYGVYATTGPGGAQPAGGTAAGGILSADVRVVYEKSPTP